ncbi:SufE family protein [Rheinheimera sp.]|uniref:SufE family protein n=1 Tax=Rheinheimera sp. TaxID=1869214 RepID=UPI00307E0EAC
MVRQDIFTNTAVALDTILQEQLPLLLQTNDWQSKYRSLMQLGKLLPTLPDELKRDELKVRGCESQFWLVHYKDTATQRHYWAFDSDARIIKGLACILICQLNGLPSSQLQLAQAEQLLATLQLAQNLSPSRNNGLYAVLEKIKVQAGVNPS